MATTPEATRAQPIDLTITRVFDAPRDLVFSMWSSPDHMKRWFGPKGFTIIEADMAVDFRPGGTWFSHFRSGTGKDHRMTGTYREIVEPERIVFSHAWIDENDDPGHQTLITVTLDDLGGQTKLTFHQTSFETEDDRNSHEHGWGEFLDRLASCLDQRATA